MEKDKLCKFNIIPNDPNDKVLTAHECSKCKNLLIIPFECENGCSKKFCPNCLKEIKECGECGKVKFVKNERIEKIINERYKVSCKICLEKMLPNKFHQHLEGKECKIKISSNNNIETIKIEEKKISKEEEDPLVSCGESFGKVCEFKCKKSQMFYHQSECELVDNFKMIEYPLYSRLIYLLIGVGKYKDEKMKNLNAPPNDVEEVKNCLEKIGFEKNEKNLLLNENACKSDLENLLKRFKEEMDGSNQDEKNFNSHSMIFFYFSGHGVQDEEKEI